MNLTEGICRARKSTRLGMRSTRPMSGTKQGVGRDGSERGYGPIIRSAKTAIDVINPRGGRLAHVKAICCNPPQARTNALAGSGNGYGWACGADIWREERSAERIEGAGEGNRRCHGRLIARHVRRNGDNDGCRDLAGLATMNHVHLAMIRVVGTIIRDAENRQAAIRQHVLRYIDRAGRRLNDRRLMGKSDQ